MDRSTREMISCFESHGDGCLGREQGAPKRPLETVSGCLGGEVRAGCTRFRATYSALRRSGDVDLGQATCSRLESLPLTLVTTENIIDL